MLTEIELENYRGFATHKVAFKDLSVIVGRNNAGKSTIIEAVTLVSIVASRAPYLRFLPPPDWLDAPAAPKGISPSLKGIDFEFRNLGHRYEMTRATITAVFSDNKKIQIFLDPEGEEIFAVLRDQDQQPVTSKASARIFSDFRINVMPPVGRMQVREKLLQNDTVRSNLNTHLAPSHFRNQLYQFGEYSEVPINGEDDFYAPSPSVSRYKVFQRLAESTWPSLEITKLERTPDLPPELVLWVRDGPFVAEVGWVGSGLQAWLQTCWFLARCKKNSTIVLDEPDLYLHADLQRKLIRLVKGHFNQILIATHSTEVLSEVDPDSVLIVDKNADQSNFAETLPAVQTVINNIGSANNLQLTRLWAAKKCIFVEGDDIEFLIAFQQTIYPESISAISSLPCIPIEGFANWKLAAGAAKGLKKIGDESIIVYAILDPDYRTLDARERLLANSKKHGLLLHIWRRKEIENYVLRPAAIARLIANRTRKHPPKESEVRAEIESICESMKDDVLDRISSEIWLNDKKEPGVTNREARSTLDEYWSTFDGKITICPGKRIVSALSTWSQKKFDVSFSGLGIARNLFLSEIESEVIEVVEAIEKSKPLEK